MGPLQGFKIVEIAGIGPGQFCGMLLADMGAQLIRIDRIGDSDLGVPLPARYNLMNRSRRSIAVDLKRPDGVDLVLELCETADALFEGFRPGVMERLGLGPDECTKRNQRLVYGRMTGWGQTGPLADTVGHDSNYIALVGALDAIGEKDGLPSLPLNLVGDLGGGGIYLAMGMLAAMLEASRSGQGQVVDAAMTDGAASLMTLFHGLHAGGMWRQQRGSNFLDGGAPFARAYRTSDDKAVVVCAIENRFFRALLDVLGITDVGSGDQYDESKWPVHVQKLEYAFRQKSRSEWETIFSGTDACLAPVLSMTEATEHPHNVSRKTYVEIDGIRQPAPAPRFSKTPSAIQCAPEEPGLHNREVLASWGLSAARVAQLVQAGTLKQGK